MDGRPLERLHPPPFLSGRFSVSLSLGAILFFLLSAEHALLAGSAQWDLNPGSNDWNTAANWTPVTVPNAAGDTATFDVSNTTGISLSMDVTLGGAVFNSGASAYTITANSGHLFFEGAGVTNNSGITQNFTTTSGIEFHNSATAGNMTVFTNSGAGSYTLFTDTASGGNAALVNANATASIDISGLTNGGMTAGSIAGNGNLFLGGNFLAVGSDNSSTTFSGAIQDGGVSGGTVGQLIKTGTGTLTLTGASTFTGGTNVDGGTLHLTGTFADAATVIVGDTNAGVLNITNGGQLGTTPGNTGASNSGIIGGGAAGTATVDGAGSSWNTHNGSLFVGDTSMGTLHVTNGGAVTSHNGFDGEGGTGIVTVDGANSTWTINGRLEVGDGSNGNGTLNISNGGKVSNVDVNIGDGDNTTSGMVTVDTGSTWTSTGDMFVGNGGAGSLSVTNGSTASNMNGYIGSGSTGTVMVDGAGSTWTNSAALVVSNGGGSGSLTITHSGVVSADNTTIGSSGILTDDATLTSPNGVAVNSGGILKGLGSVTGNVVNDGAVNPGDDPALGTLHLTGTYQQNSDGTFNIAIGSLSFFDKLEVSSTAMIAGSLVVTLAGYTGHAGDVFDILTSSGLTGNFSSISLPSLSGGLFFTESTDANNVILTVNSPVPEPATWVAGILTTAVLCFSFWRNERRGSNRR